MRQRHFPMNQPGASHRAIGELINRLEPLIWLLFGMGIVIGTMLLTAWLSIVGIAIPLRIIPEGSLDYARAIDLSRHLLGRTVLFALIVLPIWKGAHHMRHLLLGMGGAQRDTTVAAALYCLALASTICALIAVIRL